MYKNFDNLAIPIVLTNIDRRFLGSVGGLFNLGIAYRYARCNSTEYGSRTHWFKNVQITRSANGRLPKMCWTIVKPIQNTLEMCPTSFPKVNDLIPLKLDLDTGSLDVKFNPQNPTGNCPLRALPHYRVHLKKRPQSVWGYFIKNIQQ